MISALIEEIVSDLWWQIPLAIGFLVAYAVGWMLIDRTRSFFGLPPLGSRRRSGAASHPGPRSNGCPETREASS